MTILTRPGHLVLFLSLVVLLLPEATLAQRAEPVSIQSRQQGKVAFPTLQAPFSTAQQVDEIEPNNTLEEVQVIEAGSPAVINGMAEVADEGDLIVEFQGGSTDDVED
ncbi:MAG TPA: hypothetical protein VKP65_03970, partial [Rhodothermales bacterium]|nr:hypothetical protein [Rhodothermales bacterium]